jgi:hypothetical protein
MVVVRPVPGCSVAMSDVTQRGSHRYTKSLVGAYGRPGLLTDLAVYDFASLKETQLYQHRE